MEILQDVKPLPLFFVGKNLTAERISSYQSVKLGLLTQAIGKPDTQSIWYSKEHLARLLEEVEHAEGDGLRIYFGSYEDAHEYAGQTCLVMNATRSRMIGNLLIHENVVLENEPDYEMRSSQPREVIFSPIDDEESKRDFNYGSPCPPRCDPPPTN